MEFGETPALFDSGVKLLKLVMSDSVDGVYQYHDSCKQIDRHIKTPTLVDLVVRLLRLIMSDLADGYISVMIHVNAMYIPR